MKNNVIEAEGGELVITNSHGDTAIIPKKNRREVEDMIKDGCNGCIDNFVSTLPKMSQYAQDGTLVPDDPPKGLKPNTTFSTDATRVNRGNSEQMRHHKDSYLEAQKVLSGEGSEVVFRDKHSGMSAHSFLYQNNPNYQKKIIDNMGNLSKQSGAIKYGSTDVRNKDVITPNEEWMFPNIQDKKVSKPLVESTNEIIASSIPIPGIDAIPMVGKTASKIGKAEKIAGGIKKFKPIKYNPPKLDLEEIKRAVQYKDKETIGNFKLSSIGNKYYKQLGTQKHIEKLQKFSKEYNVDFVKATAEAMERWEKGSIIGGNEMFRVAGKEVFSGKRLGKARGLSTVSENAKYRELIKQDTNSPRLYTSADNVNYINAKEPFKNYEEVVWHELSHDINKYVIGRSTKLQKELKEIFKSSEEATAKIKKLYSKSEYNLIKDKIKSEIEYVTKPTETWAFLSTNLRQELKKSKTIKDYDDIITLKDLKNLTSKQSKVWNRFSPYIKDKKKFVELFNKMTLSISPAAAYMINKNKKEEKNIKN